MNDQQRSIDAMPGLDSATDETIQSPSLAAAEGTDLTRRRVIRGAAGLAPVVLTLRSGALAASSCTGAVALDGATDTSSSTTYYSDKNCTTTAPQAAKFTTTPTGTVADGEWCIADANSTACSSPQKIHGQLYTGPGGGGTNVGQVSTKLYYKDSAGSNICTGPVTGCGGLSSPVTSAKNRTTVALLSSNSESSWANAH